MVRSIPSTSALFAGNDKSQPEDAQEIPSLAKGMYLKRIEDERYRDENYYHPEQPCLVNVSEDLLTDAAPYPFHNPVQLPRNNKEAVPTGQVTIKFHFRKWGCGSPFEEWGINARHTYPPEIEDRLDRTQWMEAIDEINNGLVKYPWPKLVWFPLIFGAVFGAVLEGSLLTIKSLEYGVIFSIFTVAGDRSKASFHLLGSQHALVDVYTVAIVLLLLLFSRLRLLRMLRLRLHSPNVLMIWLRLLLQWLGLLYLLLHLPPSLLHLLQHLATAFAAAFSASCCCIRCWPLLLILPLLLLSLSCGCCCGGCGSRSH
jgi:hypothetical protein